MHDSFGCDQHFQQTAQAALQNPENVFGVLEDILLRFPCDYRESEDLQG